MKLFAASLILLSALHSTAHAKLNVSCTFERATAAEDDANFKTYTATVASTSVNPKKIDNSATFVVELQALDNARHFVTPSMGGILVGEIVTVFADGRGLRTQHYNTGGKLSAFTEFGTCEVSKP